MKSELSLTDARSMTDAFLAELLRHRTESAGMIGERYRYLWEQITPIVLTGGKRIRPYLVMVGFGALDEQIVPVAAAQELLHYAMLMHDDVIDQDFVRRGMPNLNGHYRDAYQRYLDEPRATHYAYSMAIMAGDALISESYRLLANTSFDANVREQLAERHAQSVYEVIGGELLDVEAPFVRDAAFDPMQVYRYKTAGYSFIGPLQMGAYAAGADQDTLALLEAYGEKAGIAFQIADDLLGVYGDEATTGKSTLTDLREGKQTILVAYHRERMDNEQRERFGAFGAPESDSDVLEAIKRDMEQSGARAAAERLLEEYWQESERICAQLPDGTQKDSLVALGAMLRGRSR